jgi:hypothetical protein
LRKGGLTSKRGWLKLWRNGQSGNERVPIASAEDCAKKRPHRLGPLDGYAEAASCCRANGTDRQRPHNADPLPLVPETPRPSLFMVSLCHSRFVQWTDLR